MTLENGLRLVVMLGLLVVVVIGALVLQTRNRGRVSATASQKTLLLIAGGAAVIAAGLGLLV